MVNYYINHKITFHGLFLFCFASFFVVFCLQYNCEAEGAFQALFANCLISYRIATHFFVNFDVLKCQYLSQNWPY